MGTAVLCAAWWLTLGVSDEAPFDPASDPPPLLDALPPEDAPPSSAAPLRPIEEPGDAPADQPAPSTAEPEREQDRHDGRNEPGAVEPNDDVLMLAIDYGIIFVPVIGGPMLAPLAQGLAHKLAGETIVDNEYPNWWLGTIAGYGIYALSAGGLLGGYVLLLYGVFSLPTAPPAVALGAMLGGGALLAGSIVAMGFEPLVFYLIARSGARPALKGRGKTVSSVDDVDVE